MFPPDDYTPFGYLDNPFHTWKLHRSGVIRIKPPCGFGWLFPNAQSTIYRSSLNIGLQLGQQRAEDYPNHSVQMNCSYHSKNLFRFNWQWQNVKSSAEFYQADENVIAAIIEIELMDKAITDLSLLLLHSVYLEHQKTGLWDFGLTGRFDKKSNAMIIKSFAEGYCFILQPDAICEGYFFTDDSTQLQPTKKFSSQTCNNFFSTTNPSLFGITRIPFKTEEQNYFNAKCLFSRGVNEKQAKQSIQACMPKINTVRTGMVHEDEQFWRNCPTLEGDWPAHWKRGWIYDWETLRMNVRQPVGIFSTRWDAMQIQKPRIVLAETALDMLMMSYADLETSQEVIFGLFKDALGPQVPCAREDGSSNMVSEDGSECGTSPAWCFPFYCFESIFLRHSDRQWLKKIYPFLENYLNWWLKNRTDEEGWAVYKCSWESGQDSSIKFLIKQPTGGEMVDHLRAVDLQAAMAQSAKILSFFKNCLNRKSKYWDEIYHNFRDKTQAMWHTNWFNDFDKRNQSWVKNKDYCDVTNLAPFFASIFNEEQLTKAGKWFEYFKNNPKYWMEWASFFFMYIEACWNVGFKKLASEVLFSTVNRVYKNWDRRSWKKGEAIPGISVECWGQDKPFGAEGYGWAATLPLHFIRSLIGFRAYKPDFQNSFLLCPNFPGELMNIGSTYSIKNLKFQKNHFTIEYKVKNNKNLFCRIQFQDKSHLNVRLIDSNDKVIKYSSKNEIKIIIENRAEYRLLFL